MLLTEVNLTEKFNVSGSNITFDDDTIRDEAIDILVGQGMNGLSSQKNKASRTLKFTDGETAKRAAQTLNQNL